ncbi:formylglycine-generating enzyme family protein [Parvularcula sp. ZS-1/3]|uniref:Formylglycine-generating enzyme family protein n=1 Tax=Parvularcula mediterranea TaxID=2732508 RepID=A0A7Y3RJV9_9PROT|nr:SUMF1/EgtB/PvdO family nonheme iron enzyme [Parvularcula mediterranea]NNU14876.1 formylglycine-generating enzyme family protein [Parvularcula mediterranea]
MENCVRFGAVAALAILTGCAAKIDGGHSCPACPEMVRIPGGIFQIGSDADSPGHVADEAPRTMVELEPFEAARFEVTVGEFRAFVEVTGFAQEFPCFVMTEGGGWNVDYDASWRDPGFEQNDDHPVVCVNWGAANAYVAWLNETSEGPEFRLLSESEWEYVARAGSQTTFWWGERQDDFCRYTNGVDRSAREIYPTWVRSGECDDGYVYTAPVGAFAAPNAFGAEDLVGNVWEWVEDCYAPGFSDLPRDGSPRGGQPCEKRVLRGGAWGDYGAFYLRSAYRGAFDPDWSFAMLGFRVARNLEPR